jgi:FADH2 O2-dependent halogenase
MRRPSLSAAAYDIAVIGSGFAGSLFGMIAKQLRRSVILLEKQKHPRFATGESSTPLANLLLEELATRYNLPALAPLAKWGSWQKAHPEIACGLKRGFTFYHHVFGEASAPSDRANQLLVAASPHDTISDTHWYREEFDCFFVQEAQKTGVDYFDEVSLKQATESSDGIVLTGTKSGEDFTVHAKFVVDATGPRGFLHQALRLRELPLPHMPLTQGLYSHFSQVVPLPTGDRNDFTGEPPYPVENAAVHHVFDGGWIWVLRFNNGITSAGVAAVDRVAEQLKLRDGAPAWQRLLGQLPQLQQQFAGANLVRPFIHVPRLSFRSGTITGRNWALLPSAAGFVDPLLSTGFPLTLLGVSRLAEIVERHWSADALHRELAVYGVQTEKELLATAGLIGSLYRAMEDFPLFTSLTLLYFAAVIFSETARRLGKTQLAPSFLLCDDCEFGSRCREVFDRVCEIQTPADSRRIQEDILRIIEPINLAGLGDSRRGNWYPVDTADLYANAWKIGASYEEISALVRRCGFTGG